MENKNNKHIVNKTKDEQPELLKQAQQHYSCKQYLQAEEALLKILKQKGDNAEWLNLLARIKAQRGLISEQLNNLQKAYQLSPNLDYLISMAYSHHKLGHFNQAFQCLVEVTKNPDAYTEHLSKAGELLYKIGKFHLSANAYEKAIKLENDNEQLYYHYGVSLTFSGKIKQAQQAYEKALKLNPLFGLAYAALSKVRKATEINNNIPELSKTAKIDRNPWTGLNLYHGLAKEYDDLQRYKEAFNALQTGKKRLAKLCPHHPSKNIEGIKQLADLYANKSEDIAYHINNSTAAPIFVVGMPRTGTTVAERLLTNSPEVIAIGERNQFSLLLKQQCHTMYSSLVDADVLTTNWDTIDFDRLGEEYIESVKYLTEGNTRFVDKLPLNVLLSGAILKALPQAKIVCMMRDPLDTIIGNYRQVFEQSSGTFTYTLDLNALACFVYEFQKLAKQLQIQFPDRFTLVHYEELVENPNDIAKELYNFCRLEWQDNVLDIHKNNADIGTASAAQVKEPIHKKAVGQASNYDFALDSYRPFFEKINK